MTKVYVMVGVPGTGKSTYVKKQLEKNDKAIILSSDSIREDNPGIRDNNADVFAIMNNYLKEHLKEGYFTNIYYDATNVSRKRRRALYNNIKSWDKNAEVIIVFFSFPYMEAVKRNSKRIGLERVPEHVILRMYKQLQVPRIDVDCDDFIVIGSPIFKEVNDRMENPNVVEDIFDNIDNCSYWYSEIKLSDTSHDSKWHVEDIFTHINMTIENSHSKELKQIALFHDLGKGICKEKKEDGYCSYIRHADVGACYYLNYLSLTKYHGKDIPSYELDKLEVIRQHMLFHNEIGKKNKENNKLNERIMRLGEEFSQIDEMSKISEDDMMDMIR